MGSTYWGEMGHGSNQIVRVGTHTGKNQLRSRLKRCREQDQTFHLYRTRNSTAIMTFISVKLGYRSHFTSRRTSLVIGLDHQRELSSVYRNTSARIFRSLSSALKMDRLSIRSKLISTLSLTARRVWSVCRTGGLSPRGLREQSLAWSTNIKFFTEDLDALKLREVSSPSVGEPACHFQSSAPGTEKLTDGKPKVRTQIKLTAAWSCRCFRDRTLESGNPEPLWEDVKRVAEHAFSPNR